MDIGYDNWIPNNATFICTPIGHPEFVMPFGQTVATEFIVDHRQFNCLNRGDEKPFLIKNSGSNGTEDDIKTWTQWINTQCPIEHRRCLGSRPDRCVWSNCTYS